MNTPGLHAPAASIGHAAAAPVAPTARLTSVDAFRGWVMLLMMAEVLNLRKVAAAVPDSGLWRFLAWHQTHVQWVGASLHDLIQPSFSFLVGVALPYSIASRTAAGQPVRTQFWHAVGRALALILLGVFLRSTARDITYWTFEDTLSQIGLGYVFLFLLGFQSIRAQWMAFGAILVGYWAAFALHPLPGADFDYAAVGVSREWLAEHGVSGFAAHWQKNTDLARTFDVWFLNLFPREAPFVYNSGGYATLSFIPTLGTMILGLIAGGILRSGRSAPEKIRWLVVAGVLGVAGGAALGWLGVCPVVKRIWTPSWTVFSRGWCLLLLAAFHLVIERMDCRRWAFPLVVIGLNSIAAYTIAHLWESFIARNLVTHLRSGVFRVFGDAYEPLLHGAAVLGVMGLFLYWMYRRKLFLKI